MNKTSSFFPAGMRWYMLAACLAGEWQGDKHPDYEALLAEAREWLRKGQFFWDYVSAENSVGFHNPVKALDTLASSQQYSQKAVDAALTATSYGIAPKLEGNIRELVPPILDWSREMQMQPEQLEKHTWTRYLKVLPQKERLWRLQEKLLIQPPKAEQQGTKPLAQAK